MRGMHKKCEILIFCTVFVAGAAFSQTDSVESRKNGGRLLSARIGNLLAAPRPAVISAPLPADGYMRTLGFFCRQEIKMDRIIPVNLRFRLGSVEQCDMLEGKRAAIR